MHVAWTGVETKVLRTILDWTQEEFATALEITDRTVRNWERRGPTARPDRYYTRKLDSLVDQLSGNQTQRFTTACATSIDYPASPETAAAPANVLKLDTGHIVQHREVTDMNRRELLRVLSIATAVLAAPLDWDRLHAAARSGGVIDATTAHQYGDIGRILWRAYSTEQSKATVFGAVREHLEVLVDAVQRPADSLVEHYLRELTCDTLQLAGEILFDGNLYSEAANCYTLAAGIAEKIGAADMWACALTRHAYLALYDHRARPATDLLDTAAHIARRGDTALPTRFWVASVHAQALADLGDHTGCERAFDLAHGVHALTNTGQTVTWLRYAGDRLDEERATCYIQLGRPHTAETILEPLLDRPLSTRRRASVLIDLAAAGAQRHDPTQTVLYGAAALDLARQTHSGYISRRLSQLTPHLQPLRRDRYIDRLHRHIAPLTTTNQ